jgi:hypothetical protein
MTKQAFLCMTLGASLALLAGCTTGPLKEQGGAPGIRLTISADGELVDVEGFEAGNWVQHIKFSATTPDSLGAKVAKIKVYQHDGSEEDLGSNTGPSEHAHAGTVNAPWNAHPHCWTYYPGYGSYLTHC